MRYIIAFATVATYLFQPAAAQTLSTAQPQPIIDTIAAARDIAYPGTMVLSVDATDIERGIFKVEQIIPVAGAGPITLLFPKWLPGNHAPRGEIEKLAGLTIKAGDRVLVWKRDPVDVFAFHVDVPSGTGSLKLSFSFLSATDDNQGRVVMTPEMLNLQWPSVSVYPAGYFTRRIPVLANVTLPVGWKAGTALRPASTSGNTVKYKIVDYETLIDSPIFAGKYFRTEDLGSGVALNIVADDAKDLVIRPDQLEKHKQLVSQAIKLFGTRQFDHYDFLLALTDKLGGIGLEHHRSSENGVNPEYFSDWDAGPGRRNLLPHEFTHSWNGKHRRGADQITADFSTAMRDSLLWVYEGQTQFWGYILGARSGLFSKQDTLDAIANIAAGLDIRRGRDWRSLDDTTNDPIISARRPKGWTSYQRSEDYYNEGLLIWLEVDAIIREKSGGAKSIDDFARGFFGTGDGDWGVKAYEFKDVVKALNTVVAYDWSALLNQRLSEKAGGAPLNGLIKGGYRLSYSDTPTPFFKDAEKRAKEVNLAFSLGGVIGKNGKLTNIIWDGALFNAGLTVASEIIAVNARAYSDDVIKDAIVAAKGGAVPIRLIVKTGDRVREVAVPYFNGPRYPRLEKIGAVDSGLDQLLKPRL